MYHWCSLHLAGPDFDVEVVPLVGDLEDFWPGKPVDPQPVSVDEEATCTNSQHDLHTLRVLWTSHTPQEIIKKKHTKNIKLVK